MESYRDFKKRFVNEWVDQSQAARKAAEELAMKDTTSLRDKYNGSDKITREFVQNECMTPFFITTFNAPSFMRKVDKRKVVANTLAVMFAGRRENVMAMRASKLVAYMRLADMLLSEMEGAEVTTADRLKMEALKSLREKCIKTIESKYGIVISETNASNDAWLENAFANVPGGNPLYESLGYDDDDE